VPAIHVSTVPIESRAGDFNQIERGTYSGFYLRFAPADTWPDCGRPSLRSGRREWVWTIGNGGFVLCGVALILLRDSQMAPFLYVMVIAQGLLGYGLTSVMGAIPAEILEGRNYGSIFGTVMLAAILGGAAGPWVTAALHDRFGTYLPAFLLSMALSLVSAITIWLAAPRKVRAVAGRMRKAVAD
jgi:MFS family permease